MKINIGKLYKHERRQIADNLFVASVFVAFFGSMNVWFMVPLHTYFPILAFLLALASYLISRTSCRPIFTESYFLLPTTAFALLAFYQCTVNALNFNAYISATFSALMLFFIFRYNRNLLDRIATLLSKTLGGLLLVSYPVFLLYIIGFPLPNVNMVFNDGFYSFSNYFLFLIDDRSLFTIIPRFQSIFLEPTYLGSTTALLLMTQRGKWKRWYNISLMAGLLISFSLAGYAYFIAIIFLNMWMERKKIMAKFLSIVILISTIVGGSFIYNDGDNMLHNLIILRLEIDDGEMAGNNRVSKDFDTEYESFLQTSDVVFGRDYDYSNFGDSGYKVFFYDYGIIGVILLYVFYVLSFAKFDDYRCMLAAIIVMTLVFGVDAFVLWFGRFIPLYIAAMRKRNNKDEKKEQQKSIEL